QIVTMKPMPVLRPGDPFVDPTTDSVEPWQGWVASGPDLLQVIEALRKGAEGVEALRRQRAALDTMTGPGTDELKQALGQRWDERLDLVKTLLASGTPWHRLRPSGVWSLVLAELRGRAQETVGRIRFLERM